MTPIDIRHGHLFCGLGGGAKGFNANMRGATPNGGASLSMDELGADAQKGKQ